jgi:DNA-binding CsgD family transcriptional regulator
MSYTLTATEAEALRQLTASLTLGRTLPDLTAQFARSLAPLISFAMLSARLAGEPAIRVGPDGNPVAAEPAGSTTRVYVARPVAGGGEVALTMRRLRMEPFSARDIMILELAAPGFAWAVSGRAIANEAPSKSTVADEAGLLPASGTLLLDGEGKVLGTDGAGARLARACCPADPKATVPGALQTAVRGLAASKATEWTENLTLQMRKGGFVRVRLARVGGRKLTIVAFLAVMPGGAPAVENEAMTSGLTLRERDVAERAARGLSNTEIARELGIAADTVKKHLSIVFEKTGVEGRTELAGRLFAKTDRGAPGGK